MSVFDPPAPPSIPSNPPAAWAQRLKALGLGPLGAAFLSTSQPLAPFAAQIVYLSQPLLGSWLGQDSLTALAEQLEEPEQSRALIAYWQDEGL